MSSNHELMKEVIKHYGKEIQTFVAIEEMSELMKELSKDMRGEQNRDQIIEELADVYIMLDQIQIMHDIDLNDVFKVMNKKCDRIRERIEHESV